MAARAETLEPVRRRRFMRLRRALAPIGEARGIARAMFWSGALITGFFVVLALFASIISPYAFDQYQSGGHRFAQLQGPSGSHLFGTNVQSTDVLARVIYGTQTELKVVVLALVFSVAVGVPVGLISGYFGGWLDRVIVLVMDALFAFPYLLLAIVIAFLLSSSIGQGVFTAAIAITVVYIPQYFRVVRNHVISIREEPYVEAARAIGAKPFTIMRRYVFFNVVQNVPVIATLNAADAVGTLAGLGFLGYGIQPTAGAEWGYDIQRAVSDATSGIWWTGLFPGLALVLLIIGLTLLGEGLNETINPVLRRRRIVKVELGSPEGEPESGAISEAAF